jgi:hypothetical protein
MDPDRNLAVESYIGGVSNSNLYFSSWGGFILSISNFFVCLSISIRSLRHLNTDDSSRASWAALIATSFVVMVASIRIHRDIDCDQSEGVIDNFDAVCERTKAGISLGAISTVIAATWSIVSFFWVNGSIVEFSLALLLLTVWTCGVVVLTFDEDKSPGNQLGNLFFFTWGSWSLNAFMSIKGLQNILKKSPPPDDSNTDTSTMKEDIEDEPAMENGTINNVDTEQGKAEAVGTEEGNAVGTEEGNAVGTEEGNAVGTEEGNDVGTEEGNAVGTSTEEGNAVGTEEGNAVGAEQDNAGAVVNDEEVDIEQGNTEEVGMKQGISKEVITEQDAAGKVDMEQGNAEAVDMEQGNAEAVGVEHDNAEEIVMEQGKTKAVGVDGVR